MSQVTGQTLLNTLLEKLDVQLSDVAVNFYVNLLDGLLEGGASSQALAQNLANAPEIRAHLEAQGATAPLAQVNLLAESVSETIADLDDGETPAISFSLTESTDAVAEADAEASEYSVQANAAQYANAETFNVTLPAADADSEPTELEVDVSGVDGGADLAATLNGTTAFADAGLEASFDAATGTLTIADENGRDLSDSIALIGAPEDSSATVTLLESRLVNTEIVRLTIDGEQVELRGVTGTTGAEVEASIAGKLAAIEDADGEKPYANVTVEFDGDASTLTIADDDRREIGGVSLQRTSDSEVAISLGDDALADVQQLELTLNGETKLVAFSAADGSELADNIEAAFELDGGISVDIDETGDAPVITITDTWGRDFGATQLLGEGDPAVPSETVVGPLAADDVGQFSVTIGSGESAVTIENLDVSDNATRAELVAAINQAFTDAGLTDAEAAEEGTDSIKIVNNAGTGISNVYVGTALAEDDASSVEISGLTDVLAGNVASFEIQIGGQTYTLTDADADDLAAGEVNFGAITSTNQLVNKLEEALQAQEIVTGRTDISVAVKNADDDAATDSQTLVITDAAGRELSGVAMAGAEDAGQASAAVVSGINDDAVRLDLGYVEVKYTDSEGNEETLNNVTEDVTTLDDLVTALNTALGSEFTVQVFGEDETLVITDTAGNELTSVEFKTGPNGVTVVDGVEIIEAIEAEEGVALDIGTIGAVENATSAAPVFGVEVTVEEAGSVDGLNAPQLGADGSVTASEETAVTVIGTEYDAGAEGQPVGSGLAQTAEGTEATDATAWTATLDVVFEAELEADYTFTLSLTEVLGEDAAEGTEAAVFNFTVDAVAGETSADVLANMAAAIDADEAFAAVVSEEGQLVVTAEAEATNYTVETGVELVAVEEPQIVEAA